MHNWTNPSWSELTRRGIKRYECRPYDNRVRVGDIVQIDNFYVRVTKIWVYDELNEAVTHPIYPGLSDTDTVLEYVCTWQYRKPVMVARIDRCATPLVVKSMIASGIQL